MSSLYVVRHDDSGPDHTYLEQPAGSDEKVRFWWLGQAGFAFEYAGHRVLIDPYLSDSLARKYAGTLFPHTRLHPAPVDPALVRGVQVVLHTHAHTDHLDPDTVRALLQHNSPLFVAPRARRSVALQRNIPEDNLQAVTAGDTVEVAAGITITVVPAAHEQLEFDDNGDSVFLGFILTIGGIRIYHSGDCVPYDGQAEILRSHNVNIAFLPINGRDDHRLQNGVPGNFTVREAASLCRTAKIPALVGHHFGLFDFNTVPRETAIEELTDFGGELRWTLPKIGWNYVIEPVQQLLRTEKTLT